MTDARDFQPSGTTVEERERERGEKLAAKSRGFFADQRIADCSLEFVAISQSRIASFCPALDHSLLDFRPRA